MVKSCCSNSQRRMESSIAIEIKTKLFKCKAKFVEHDFHFDLDFHSK